MDEGVNSVVELLKKHHVAVECCITSNECLSSTTRMTDREPPPIVSWVREGVSVVLGSDNPGMWSAVSAGVSDEAQRALDLGVTRAELGEMMARAFELCRAAPAAVAKTFAAEARAWATRADATLAELPKVDLHIHLIGAIPLAYMVARAKEMGFEDDDTPIEGPVPGSKPPVVALSREAQFGDMAAFLAVYRQRSKFIQKLGISDVARQIEVVAAAAAAQNVRMLEIQLTARTASGPHQTLSKERTERGDHKDFQPYFDFLEDGRQRALAQHGVYVAFIVAPPQGLFQPWHLRHCMDAACAANARIAGNRAHHGDAVLVA